MINSRIIYLACPYANIEPEVRERRFMQVTEAARLLTIKGYIVFSPITHAHPLQVEVRNGWNFWKQLDIPILEVCGLLIVLKLTGWDRSVGVNGEVQAAFDNGIPTMYIEQHEIKIIAELVESWDFQGQFLPKERTAWHEDSKDGLLLQDLRTKPETRFPSRKKK